MPKKAGSKKLLHSKGLGAALRSAISDRSISKIAELADDACGRLNVNSHLDDAHTPLGLAAAIGDIGVISFLHKILGADLTFQSLRHELPIMVAARCGHQDVVEYFLSAGCPINARSSERLTALMSAAEGGHDELVAYLLSKGASVGRRDNAGRNALYFARTRQAAQWFIDLGANVNCVSAHIYPTPLLNAIARDCIGVVEALLEAGAHGFGTSATATLTFGRSSDIVKLLLAYGCHPNALNDLGECPLSLALRHRNQDAVKELLRAGADPLVKAPSSTAVDQLTIALDDDFEEAVVMMLALGMPIIRP